MLGVLEVTPKGKVSTALMNNLNEQSSKIDITFNLKNKKKIKLKKKKKDKHFVFRGKLYWDRFKNKLSEYILSPSFVFKLPSAPLFLVFSHGGRGRSSYHDCGGDPLWDPSLAGVPRCGLHPLADVAVGALSPGLWGCKKTECHLPQEKQCTGLRVQIVAHWHCHSVP